MAAGPQIIVMSGGGDGAGLARALDQAAANKASAIISFGVAGGLAPGLASGAALVARSIVAEDGQRYYGDPKWSRRLSTALGGAPIVDMAGVDAPVVDHATKHALHLRTGAFAVDMESHIAARVAAAHGLPFAAFRVVADPAERRLPHAALVGMQADGSLALGAVARSLLRDPRQVPQLLQAALDARAAFTALLRGRKMLVGALGFTEFRELVLDLPPEDVIGRSLPV
ncbi:phosphorylase [Methylocapsa acidiphila]|uniref:phosphorylase family protein n=1 Tax=Methylocapsa acidiphila TaxID=133552 RepID=UPI001FD93F03|nr:phosphorylase [Methylocapsa acidiphila]